MIVDLRRVLTEPYRVFFLAAGIYAIFALLVWEMWLGVHFAGGMMSEMPFSAAPHFWHAHEMIFGYASAALGGFFLTAVPNWTGSRNVVGGFVTFAASIWLAGRMTVWFSGALPPGLVAAVDLAFLPLLAIKITLLLIKRPKLQNVAFLAFLALVWTGNLMMHLEWMSVTETLDAGMRVGLLALCLMIAVVGGRITPAFTRNTLKRAGHSEASLPRTRRSLDLVTTVLIALLPVNILADLSPTVLGAISVAAGILQILRVFFWGPHKVWRHSILWSLHLGMTMLGFGLVLWGLSALEIGSEVAALHVLGIGAVGGMTLAVMSRAVLGHTGRTLVAPRMVTLVYGFIALAAGVRWFASTLSGKFYFPLMLATGALWITAFSIFVVALWPAFTGPRADLSD